jgi:hypothetical protein
MNNPTLKDLDSLLFQTAAETLSSDKKQLLAKKWEQIRNIGAQNAGYGYWGSHLLNLDPQQMVHLQSKFKETIRSIEEQHLHLEESFIQMHPELIGLRFLIDPSSEAFKQFFQQGNVKALLWEYDEKLVAQHRAHFQEVFKFLYLHPTWKARDNLVSEMLVGNLIALLPYFDFENQSEIQLLRYVNQEWKLVTYEIRHIPLIEGEIYAYGLEPTKEFSSIAGICPILIFRGTPYPAAKGFLEALWSDLHPIKSIGEEIFEKGKTQLDQWIKGKSKVECYGMSLGGALAYHAGHAYGEKVEVRAYAAPGLIPMKGGMSKIHGRVFFHLKDLVRSLGYHPESKHFEIYAVLAETDLNFITAHAHPAGLGPTLVLKIDPRLENQTWKRYMANILKIFVSTILFLILLPIKLCVSGIDFMKKALKKIPRSFS